LSQHIEITRIFDAPRELVYRAFTDPGQLAQWFGPDGCSVPRDSIEIDAHPGGFQRFVMTGPDVRSPVDMTFTESVTLRAVPAGCSPRAPRRQRQRRLGRLVGGEPRERGPGRRPAVVICLPVLLWWHSSGMPRGNPWPKLAITVDPDVHAGVVAAAAAEGVSVSAWMTEAARGALRVRDGLTAVGEWEAEHGPLTGEELAAARRRVAGPGAERRSA
jgi:activator of Hsp90 ATPase-like protein